MLSVKTQTNRGGLALTVAVAAAAAFTATAAHAADAFTLTKPGLLFTGSGQTLGFEFSVTGDETLTALGVFDQGKDGLVSDTPIGLWDSEGNLLVSTIVAKGPDGGELDGLFRFNAVDPFQLTAGTDYVVGAMVTTDTYGFLNFGTGSKGTVDPRVHIVEDRSAGFGKLLFPNQSVADGAADFGANFRFADAVPEPASWALMISGFCLVGAQLRARRRIGNSVPVS
jgi:hypothetical protein